MKRSPAPQRKTPLARSAKPLKRTATKRAAAPIARGKKPKPMSAHREAEQDQRRAVVAFVHKRDRVCQAQAVHALTDVPCSGPLDCHELVSRAQWRAGIYDARNVALCCRSAHTWITAHPVGAHALGLLLWSYERDKILALPPGIGYKV